MYRLARKCWKIDSVPPLENVGHSWRAKPVVHLTQDRTFYNPAIPLLVTRRYSELRTMAVDTMVVLPGEHIPQEALPTPTGKKKTLTLGPGLRPMPPNTIATTIAGALNTDNKKNAAWVESNSGRVRIPALHDF